MLDFTSAFVAEVEAILDHRRDLADMQRRQKSKLKQEKMMRNRRLLFLILLLMVVSLMLAACTVPQQNLIVPTTAQDAAIEALAGSDTGGCSICKAT